MAPISFHSRDRVSAQGFPEILAHLLASLLGLATFVSASSFPIVMMQTKPVVGDWCVGLRGDVIDNLDNFTLSARNPSGNSPNTTGVPLVLSVTGSTAGSSIHTWAVSV
jgi:hypothetical protein